MRRFAILCGLLLTISSCQFEPSSTQALTPAEPVDNGEPTPKMPKPAPSCVIYEKYAFGNCASLVERASLSGTNAVAYSYSRTTDARYKAPVRLIDLTKFDLTKQITPNFKIGDYMAVRKGAYGFIAEHVFGLVQKVRDFLGVPLSITSGYRSPGYNKTLKGSASLSRHLYGDGIDLVATRATQAQIRNACKQAGASYIQLYTDGHVHCDWRNHAPDKTFTDDDSIDPPTLTEIATMSDEEYALMQNEIGGEPIIAVEGELLQGNTVNFTAHIEEQEDGGELVTEWVVVKPDGEATEIEGSILELELLQRGQYEVSVRVGGYLETTHQFDVH